MAKKYKMKDNALLVEFDFVIDLDIALWKLICAKYGESDLIDHDLSTINDDAEITKILLSRQNINPLEILIPGANTQSIYDKFMTDPKEYKELLSYSKPYDTYRLMITFLENASSVYIDILCKDNIQKEHIESMNTSGLNTVIYPDYKMIPVDDYSALYLKYFENAMYYPPLTDKHIYIPMAQYNMQRNVDTINLTLTRVFGESNKIHLIDLYQDVKFRFTRNMITEEESENNNETSAEQNQE